MPSALPWYLGLEQAVTAEASATGLRSPCDESGGEFEARGEEWFWADPMGVGLTRWKVEVVKGTGGSGEGITAVSKANASALSTTAPSAPATRESALPTPVSSKPNNPSPTASASSFIDGVPDVIYADAIPSTVTVSAPDTTVYQLHLRLGHLSPKRIGHLVTELSTGLSLPVNRGPGALALDCLHCVESFEPEAVGVMESTSGPISVVHLELRKMHAVAPGGEQYIFLLVDDFTRFTWIYYVHKPHDILKIFTRWNKERRAEGFDKPRHVYAGPGMVVIADDFAYHLRHNFDIGYLCRRIVGSFDHASNTLLALCTTAVEYMRVKQLPADVWAEVLRATVYLQNVTPTPKRDAPPIIPSYFPNAPLQRDHVTPTELLYGNKPDLAHLRAIGCAAWGPVHGADPRELVQGILVGYGPRRSEGETYRLWDQERGVRIVLATSKVVVDETTSLPAWNALNRMDLYDSFGLAVGLTDEGEKPPMFGPCTDCMVWAPRAIPNAWETMSGAYPYGRTNL
ncbi:hypothetical protein IAT38_003782 [Cryptococcus sp. DSM 104549]